MEMFMTHQSTTASVALPAAGAGAKADALAALGINLVPRWTNCLSFFLASYEAGDEQERAASLKALQEMAAAADTACALLDGLEAKAAESGLHHQSS